MAAHPLHAYHRDLDNDGLVSVAQTSLSASDDPQGFALRADQPAFLTANLGRIFVL